MSPSYVNADCGADEAGNHAILQLQVRSKASARLASAGAMAWVSPTARSCWDTLLSPAQQFVDPLQGFPFPRAFSRAYNAILQSQDGFDVQKGSQKGLGVPNAAVAPQVLQGIYYEENVHF